MNEFEQCISEWTDRCRERDVEITLLREALAQARSQAINDFVTGKDKLCLVCGATEPCELKDDPASPCTFDHTPMELYHRCQRLTKELAQAEQRELELRHKHTQLQQVIAGQRRVLATKGGSWVQTKLHLLKTIEHWRAKAQGELPNFGHGSRQERIDYLEQQLAAMTQERDKVQLALTAALAFTTTANECLQASQAQVTRLREALRVIANTAHSDNTLHDLIMAEDIARAALAPEAATTEPQQEV